MEAFVDRLRRDYPGIRFVKGDIAHWSSETRTIAYALGDATAVWSLLHELGHGLLEHDSYTSDVSLLQKEAAAWAKARELAPLYNAELDDEYVEGCLDTYRDWLHKRSTCPDCSAQGLQRSRNLYVCINCAATWKVTENRFCRPYRLKEVAI